MLDEESFGFFQEVKLNLLQKDCRISVQVSQVVSFLKSSKANTANVLKSRHKWYPSVDATTSLDTIKMSMFSFTFLMLPIE